MTDDRELPGFQARTTIDDIVGKLMFIRKQLWDVVPDGVAGRLDDVEYQVEEILPLVEDLPEPPMYRMSPFGVRVLAGSPNGGVGKDSASKCVHEGCSCGMPTWSFREGS